MLYLQVILLQYCRGRNTGRTNVSHQELSDLCLRTGVTRLPVNYRDDFLRTDGDHSWATADLSAAENYYVVFSTLSDSKYVLISCAGISKFYKLTDVIDQRELIGSEQCMSI